MKLSIQSYFLEFIHPFVLAHGTRLGTQLAFVKIEHESITAYGEASFPPYLKETYDSAKNWIDSQTKQVFEILGTNLFENPESIPFSFENTAASAALQSALLNWYATSKGKTLRDYFEQTHDKPKLTLTITKNDTEFLKEKIYLEKHFTHFKLKLTGKADDLDFVKLVRNKTTLPFCIDINQGYQNKEQAIQLISELEMLDCVLIEQPLHKQDHDGHLWLKQRTLLPIIADESICLYEDLVQYHEAYSGTNIKLMKCGGLIQAQTMIRFIQSNINNNGTGKFMKLIGCMSESSLGISSATALATQCDMADLDSPYLNKNDPFKGFTITNKTINVNNKIELINKDLFNTIY